MLNHRVCTRMTLWSPTPLPAPALHAGNIPFTASARGRQTTALLPRPGSAGPAAPGLPGQVCSELALRPRELGAGSH